MTPYYDRGGVRLFLGDCREILPTLTPKSCDLLVTDPPYGYARPSEYGGAKFRPIAGNDDAEWVAEAIELAVSAVANRRHIYVFGPESLVGGPVGVKTRLVWDKGAMGGGDWSSPWGPAHEDITFAVVSRGREATVRGGGPARLRSGTVLRCPRPPAVRHPTEKPVPLLRRLIESSSRVGESVLDPFVGVGSTLVAAVAEGRTGVGIECDERYLEIAANRIDRALDAYSAMTEAVA